MPCAKLATQSERSSIQMILALITPHDAATPGSDACVFVELLR
eukprot:SAG31_NODE_21651_length_544_cov_1.024719_1_plen_42_part_10